jgi:hypothetical protein
MSKKNIKNICYRGGFQGKGGFEQIKEKKLGVPPLRGVGSPSGLGLRPPAACPKRLRRGIRRHRAPARPPVAPNARQLNSIQSITFLAPSSIAIDQLGHLLRIVYYSTFQLFFAFSSQLLNLSTLFLGAPPAECSFSPTNLLGGYPRGVWVQTTGDHIKRGRIECAPFITPVD